MQKNLKKKVIKVKIPHYIDKRIEEMSESEKKQAWEELQKTDKAYITVPNIDKLNYKYKDINNFIKLKTLPSLKYTSQYYHYVNDIYQKYDYILNTDFFDCVIHPNEYDAIYVTKNTREHEKRICDKIDERIKKLEKDN